MPVFLKKNIFLFFLVIAVADVLAAAAGMPDIQVIAKPLLLPLLIFGLFLHTNRSTQRNILATGLFFSFLGDVFLMLDKNEMFFIVGLICFLITHIFYSIYFIRVPKKTVSLIQQQPWLLAVVALYTGGLLALLLPVLGDLRLPVVAYACVLSLMLVCCLHACNSLQPKARKWFIAGTVLFVLSDSLLAINKFYTPFYLAGFLIMLSYCGAQYCIVKGFIKNEH